MQRHIHTMRPEGCFYCFPPFGSPAASFSNADEQKSLALLNQYSEILSCERDQLKKRALLAQALPLPDVGVPVYKAGTEVKPYETEKKGLEEAKKKKVDVGRLQAPPGTARRTRRSESRRQFAEYASTRPSPRGFGAKN